MSLRRGYKSKGTWDSERSVFEFKDEFGQDPIMGRYGSGPGSQALAEARVARSASEVQLAQASLDAMTRPAKVMSDFFTTMNQTAKAKDDMLKRSRVSAQSIKLRERLNEANDYDSLTALRADPELSDAFEDETMAGQYDSKLRGLRARGIATLQNRLPKATSTAEVDGLVNEYSWLAGDQEAQTLINTFTPLAQRREAAMKGLVEAGAQQMPVTPTGEFDVDRAERALSGTYTSQDVRSLQGTASNLTKQLANFDDPEDPEAQKIQVQLDAVNSQLGNAAMQQERGALRAQAEGQSLGIGASDTWADDIIDGGSSRPKPSPVAEPSVQAPDPVTAPTPVPVAQDPISRAEAQATAAEAEKQRLEAEATAKRRSEVQSMEDQEEAGMGELERAYSVVRRPGLDKKTFSEVAARIKQLRMQAGEDEAVVDNELRELTPTRFRS